MTESEWLTSTGPQAMLAFLQSSGRTSERKLRLFAVACCRRIWHLLKDVRSREAVAVVERYSDGKVDEAELHQVNRRMAYDEAGPDAAAFLASVRRYDRPSTLHRYGIVNLACLDARAQRRVERICLSGLRFPAEAALAVARRAGSAGRPGEALHQADLLRDLFGSPFCPPAALPASIRTWSDGLVIRLTTAAYEHRLLPSGYLDPDRLAVLADALEDAGCPPDHELLLHLRGPGPHWRGCFAVDAILGRQ